MTTLNQELYEALIAAGAPDDAAKRAAASVLSHEQRTDLATKADIAALKEDIAVVRTEIERMGRVVIMWNVGTLLAVAGFVYTIIRFGGSGS
jgi:hypothetical protein